MKESDKLVLRLILGEALDHGWLPAYYSDRQKRLEQAFQELRRLVTVAVEDLSSFLQEERREDG